MRLGFRQLLRTMAVFGLRLVAWPVQHAAQIVALAALALVGLGCWWIYPPAALIVVGVLLLLDVIHSQARNRDDSG